MENERFATGDFVRVSENYISQNKGRWTGDYELKEGQIGKVLSYSPLKYTVHGFSTPTHLWVRFPGRKSIQISENQFRILKKLEKQPKPARLEFALAS